jgi:hypothetical protein
LVFTFKEVVRMGDEQNNLKLRRLVASFLDENILLSSDMVERALLSVLLENSVSRDSKIKKS